MLVMIDNYDSFTYNLVQYFGELGEKVKVFRNDKVSLEKIQDMNPDYLVISPGPCFPKQAGISLELIKELKGKLPILGVCLGHQAIAEAFGANIVKANYPMHGKISVINHDGDYLFKGLEKNLSVTRYHSLVIEPSSLSDDFIVNARTEDDIIMAIQHKTLNISGVQFHPESIMTKQGKKLLQNFLNSK